MLVCIVYKEEYPWDVRVEKIAKSIVAAGNEVVIAARNLRQECEESASDGIRVVRLSFPRGLPQTIRRIANMALFFNPLWIVTIIRATRNDCRLIIVRDLPLAFAGILVSRLRRISVILDMAECYPLMYASQRRFRVGKGLTRIWKSERIASVYEKLVCWLVDGIFVVVEESRDRLVAMNVPENKITIVSNTPSYRPVRGRVIARENTDLRVIYVGFVTKLRGLDLLVAGASRVREMTKGAVHVHVDIIGEGDARPMLVDLVSRLGMRDSVRIHGWLDNTKVEALMHEANVGALTYRVCEHWNNTVPNKLFDYMQAGLPVISTRHAPTARIIEAEQVGVVCETEEPDQIARGLLELADPRVRERLGMNGKAAITSKYNWQGDAERMMVAIEALSRKRIDGLE